MALPVILVDSATGSDSAASGAGPSTALTGTAGATDGAGTTVTLDSGTDLTNVATDGSHVIYFVDTTAGHRRFSKITGKAGSGGATPNVTVNEALTISLSGKSWAIGGKRSTVTSATSKLLFDNNTAAGDAMPGWIVEMQSGHTESYTTALDMRRSGDTTSGPITLRGAAGASTLPKLTATSAFNMIVLRGGFLNLQDFEMTAGAASITSALLNASTGPYKTTGIKLSRTSSNSFTTGFSSLAAGWYVADCEIAFCATGLSGSGGAYTVEDNWLHNISGSGITEASDTFWTIQNNIIVGCGADGINVSIASTGLRTATIRYNTIHGCTGSGIKFTASNSGAMWLIENNNLTFNGAYGLNFSNAAVTDIMLAGGNIVVRGNNTYNNTSGAYHSNTGAYAYNACPWATGDSGLDPSGGLADATHDYSGSTALNNFMVGAAVKALAYPLGGTLLIGKSATYSYVDPGAAQRQEAGSGATFFVPVE